MIQILIVLFVIVSVLFTIWQAIQAYRMKKSCEQHVAERKRRTQEIIERGKRASTDDERCALITELLKIR